MADLPESDSFDPMYLRVTALGMTANNFHEDIWRLHICKHIVSSNDVQLSLTSVQGEAQKHSPTDISNILSIANVKMHILVVMPLTEMTKKNDVAKTYKDNVVLHSASPSRNQIQFYNTTKQTQQYYITQQLLASISLCHCTRLTW